MADIRIDLVKLEELGRQLTVVATDLESAETFSTAVAAAAGDERLASVIRQFGEKWNIRRHDLIEQIRVTAAAAQAIHETFEELDREIAGGLISAITGKAER